MEPIYSLLWLSAITMVVSRALLFFAWALSVEWQFSCQHPTSTPQSASYDAVAFETQTPSNSLVVTPAGDTIQGRVPSENGTIETKTPAEYFTTTEETSTPSELSNKKITSDVSKDVTKSTHVEEGYSAMYMGVHDTRLYTTATIYSIGSSLATFTRNSEHLETIEDINARKQNNLLTTSATTKDSQLALSDYMSYRIGKSINKYAQPVIAVVGIVGNTISMLVMFQPHNRHTSFGVYLGTLALSDTLVLCISTSFWFAALLSTSPLRDIDCKVHGYMVNSLQMNGFFLILGFTFDRLMAVRFPLTAVTWCNSRRARFVSVVTFMATWVVNVPYFIYNHVENNNICSMGTAGSVMSFVFPWIAVFLGLVVPFVSLISMNLVIIFAIVNRRRQIAKYAPGRRCEDANAVEMSEPSASSSQNNPHNQSRDNRRILPTQMTPRDRNAIVTLFLVSFTFLLFVTPHFVKLTLFSMANLSTSTLSPQADYTLMFQVTRKLYFTNNACNFFLYCLSGTRFRNDVAKLFLGKTCTGSASTMNN